MGLYEKIIKILFDRWCLHFDAYTWYRQRLIRKFMIKGPIKVLNVGTGGGVETINLLRRGNNVTTVEIDEVTAAKTLSRVNRHGFADRYTGLVGHILSIDLAENFHEIYICEVLEHITDDLSTLHRLSDLLLPGGRLILSTPTASYGQLFHDTVTLQEKGGHVRVGYDGPELDELLKKTQLFPLRRIYNGNSIIKIIHSFERWLASTKYTVWLRYPFSFCMRLVLPLLDIPVYRPFDQITIAIKVYW